MTVNRNKQDTRRPKANKLELENENKSLACMIKKHVQLCAWVLLTVGLCIIITIFYLALKQNYSYNDALPLDEDVFNSGENLKVASEYIDFGSGMEQVDIYDDYTHSSKSGRLRIKQETLRKNKNVCQEKFCQIVCTNVANVYAAVHAALKTSSCPSIALLILEEQNFAKGVLKNYWLPSNVSSYEVKIRNSNITRIKSNAFNSPLFKNTFALTLSNMNIAKLDSGVLLGLNRLKYLTIKSNIQNFATAILQPVQMTLFNLILNANLQIKGNENLFAVSDLSNLQHLDLSNNVIIGPLGKRLFKSTPNLKYLILMECFVQTIEEDAFEKLTDKLLFLNLSKNRLSTLPAAVLKPMLLAQELSMLSLANNEWICNCQLRELAEIYKEYHLRFVDTLYCKGPHRLYGVSLDEVDFVEENCLASLTTAQEWETTTATETTTIKTTTLKNYVNDGGDGVLTEPTNTMKMRCNDYSTNIKSKDNEKALTLDGIESSEEIFSDDLKYLLFPPPSFDFQLKLLAENNSVVVIIDNPAELLVIWFSEQLESSVISYDDTSIDYECMSYAVPELMVGPLLENTTYTFCLLPFFQDDISPFNCLPLHVPSKKHENIWISEDNKHLTIGMLCVIFMLSTIAGASIAYYGIKAYPELLEGSKNVLVVKKPDQECYVTTISEVEYQKKTSLENKKPFTKKDLQKQQSLIKLQIPDVPTLDIKTPPHRLSVKDLEKFSSLKSSWTCFEDTYPNYNFVDDDYEMPAVCDDEFKAEQHHTTHTYAMSPKSPPPLPKRNSNVSNSSILVKNRFSSTFN